MDQREYLIETEIDVACATRAAPLIFEGLNALHNEAHANALDGTGPLPTDKVLYAVTPKKEVVGVLVFRESPDALVVVLLYVEPTSRQEGLGRALAKHLTTLAAELGKPCVRFEVAANNAVAVDVLKRVDATHVRSIFEIDVS